ncbi:hypothetical protein QMK19_35295 [Streptomyces sp. H10-C2]|uniref:hypothetical protein n=1 Tax=unclassified Streptomyces TaxID=2593676 RepID=UPI0024B93B1D|nr:MULTISPECIES: hypothetical protein [unclassified Streptomyces]MDJ0345901.1 hypothetical protein [Streptomyces sp. PH10-H1]MDJ0374750.1 hypothetical protein [Streptomyces sp. H10-C2]
MPEDFFRRAWRWPFYSPRRLLAVVAGLAVLLIALNTCNGSSSHQPTGHTAPSAAPAASTQPAAGATSTPPVPTASDLAAAMDTARSFVSAWASHPATHAAWVDAMRPYTTGDFAQKIATGDPRNIGPTKALTARVTMTGTSYRTQAAVTTDKGVVSVSLVSGDNLHWRVDNIRPGAQAVE